jgi:plastocyanin
MPSTSMRNTLLVRGAVLTLATGALAGCGVSDDPLAKVNNPSAKELTAQARASGSGAQAQLPRINLGAKNQGSGKGEHGGKGGNGNGGKGGNGNGDGGHGGDGNGNGKGGNGNGNGNGGGSAGAVVVRGPKTTRKISADASGKLEFSTSDLWAPPGRVTITLTNPSSVLHGIAIAGANGVNTESKAVGKGGRASVTVSLPAGDYEFYCPVDGHREAGMSGILSVGNLPPSAR